MENHRAVDIIFATLFGLIIGSFLNVVIYRMPRKLSLSSPRRSYCPKCNKTLAWSDNIPVISWTLLAGKCRYCKEPISGQYPLVELLSGIAGAASVIYYGTTFTAGVVYLLTATLIAITFIDFEFKIIPNRISYPGMTIGLLMGIATQFYGPFPHPLTQSAIDSLFGMIAGGGFFWSIGALYYLVTKRVGLGGGDIKLMGMTGAILGLQSVAPTIFIGSLLGSVVGIALMVIGKGGRQTEIPFGPWLSLGTIVYMFGNLKLFQI